MLRNELGNNDLFITGTLPGTSKTAVKSLKNIIEDEDQGRAQDINTDIGFYVSCELGLAFTQRNLIQMIASYRNFRNSVMVVYDVNKSAYGMGPVTCYRLSVAAIDALYLNDLSKLTGELVQDRINACKLSVESFFEVVSCRIHRSHLLQAFLVDHIQPHMPSFNTQMLSLSNDSTYLAHLLFKQSEQSQSLLDEMNRIEGHHKKMIQQAKRNNKKIQVSIVANKDKTIKGSVADKEEREALEKVKIVDDADSKMDMFLFSKQVDMLCNNITQFDDSFAKVEKAQ